MADTTNVQARELNYIRYAGHRYDRDIANSVPHHQEIHRRIGQFIRRIVPDDANQRILDLGVGTGITAELIHYLLPKSQLDVIDFSHRMLARARVRLGTKKVRYILGDYADYSFDHRYNLVVSVIGIHHQNHRGKRELFQKIFDLLKPGGYFIFGDLMTYKNPYDAALNHAKHYHHLVTHAANEKALRDWSYHHMYLNELAPIEDQISWLEDLGFEVRKEFLKMNTALLIARKPNKKI